MPFVVLLVPLVPLLDPSCCCSLLCDLLRVRVTLELYMVGGTSGEMKVEDLALLRGAGRAGFPNCWRLLEEVLRWTGAGCRKLGRGAAWAGRDDGRIIGVHILGIDGASEET